MKMSQMGKRDRPSAYARRYATTFAAKIGEFIWQQILIGAVLAAFIFWQQIRRGLIPVSAQRENVLALVVPYAIVIGLFLLWHILRAAYLLHIEDREEIERLSALVGPSTKSAAMPDISAKYLRKHFVPRSPWAGVTAKLAECMNLAMGPTEHDLLLEIYLVNRSEQATTLQRVEVEAQIDGEWRKLKEGRLSPYQLAIDKEEAFAHGGLKNVMATKQKLSILWDSIRNVELRKGIAIKDGLPLRLLKTLQDSPR